MLEEWHYDLNNDIDVVKMSNPAEANNRLKENLGNRHNAHCTIMDLVTILTDVTDKVGTNKHIAKLIALEVLNDYVNGVKISSQQFNSIWT